MLLIETQSIFCYHKLCKRVTSCAELYTYIASCRDGAENNGLPLHRILTPDCRDRVLGVLSGAQQSGESYEAPCLCHLPIHHLPLCVVHLEEGHSLALIKRTVVFQYPHQGDHLCHTWVGTIHFLDRGVLVDPTQPPSCCQS